MTQAGSYLRLFTVEASQHAEALGRLWPRLMGSGFDEDAVTELFRHAHSIKGMAASMGFEEIVDLSRVAEQLLDGLRSQRASLPEAAGEALFRASDLLLEMIRLRTAGVEPGTHPRLTQVSAELAQLTPTLAA